MSGINCVGVMKTKHVPHSKMARNIKKISIRTASNNLCSKLLTRSDRQEMDTDVSKRIMSRRTGHVEQRCDYSSGTERELGAHGVEIRKRWRKRELDVMQSNTTAICKMWEHCWLEPCGEENIYHQIYPSARKYESFIFWGNEMELAGEENHLRLNTVY